jgi:hypothetical protein
VPPADRTNVPSGTKRKCDLLRVMAVLWAKADSSKWCATCVLLWDLWWLTDTSDRICRFLPPKRIWPYKFDGQIGRRHQCANSGSDGDLVDTAICPCGSPREEPTGYPAAKRERASISAGEGVESAASFSAAEWGSPAPVSPAWLWKWYGLLPLDNIVAKLLWPQSTRP